MGKIITKPEFGRTAAEAQHAHDILHSILVQDECPKTKARIPDVVQDEMSTVLNVLCWLLGHPGGEGLQANLTILKQALAEDGYEFVPYVDPPSVN